MKKNNQELIFGIHASKAALSNSKRKVHKIPMVRIGGVAIFLGFFIGLFSVFFSGNLENISLENVSKYGRILLLSTTLVFLLGLFDDLFKLSPKFRLIFQFVVASFAWFQDLRINSFENRRK